MDVVFSGGEHLGGCVLRGARGGDGGIQIMAFICGLAVLICFLSCLLFCLQSVFRRRQFRSFLFQCRVFRCLFAFHRGFFLQKFGLLFFKAFNQRLLSVELLDSCRDFSRKFFFAVPCEAVVGQIVMEKRDGFFESVSLLLANCRRFIDVVFQFRGDLDLTVPFCNRRLDSALRIG